MNEAYDIILITGRTGTGKSKLVSSVHTELGTLIFDPLINPVNSWKAPDAKFTNAIAIDHAYYLNHEILNEIIVWCKWKNIQLWISEQNISELQANGVRLIGKIFELNLVNDETEEILNNIAENHVSTTLDTGIVLARQLYKNNQ
ncbi:hypothetical protein [Alcaligenes faecalis]|uniref:hypothetical protein n=1 Tax=Alcaligenes faecalis TaxID=511 RepID=UPI0034D6CA62